MSFNALAAETITLLLPHLPSDPSVVELGFQSFKVSAGTLKKIMERAPKSRQKRDADALRAIMEKSDDDREADTENFYRGLGFGSYTAIDIHSKFGCKLMDLNRDLMLEYGYRDTFDLVTNNGTGEHCFNQHLIFKNVHHLTKPGGIMLHVMPFLNWLNHGFFSFHPVLYADLAAANHYEIKMLAFGGCKGNRVSVNLEPSHRRTKENNGFLRGLRRFFIRGAADEQETVGLDETLSYVRRSPEFLRFTSALKRLEFAGNANVAIIVALKKMNDEPFCVPIQGRYAKQEA